MKTKYLLILILFSSCTGRDKNKAEIAKDVSLQTAQSIASNSEKFEIGDYPENKWWEEFKDDNLSCLIETAFKQSPNQLYLLDHSFFRKLLEYFSMHFYI
jgi:outer membrane protein TolC